MSATPGKIPRYIVLHLPERVVTEFSWIVIDDDDGEPALWQQHPQDGRVPLRFRSEALAQAGADQLNAEQRKK